jgi:molybdopterin biosynthesis enzyme
VPIVADDFDAIRAAGGAAAADHDLVLLNAGSSAGSEVTATSCSHSAACSSTA